MLGNLPKEALGSFPVAPLWGWRGPDESMLPAAVDGAEPVFKIVVRGTADLEVEHRLLSPNEDELSFSSERRRLLGLCRVGEMRGSSREFRMARGSLLERVLGREDVRGATARAVRNASRDLSLSESVEKQLGALGTRLRIEGVTAEEARLEVLSPPGQSLLGLLGLALGEPGEAVPLANSGQGAQRLASFVLATSLTEAPALVVMDELEVGLEPYRQRLLVHRLRELVKSSDGQAFLTTHSPTVLAELDVEELHRLYLPPAEEVGDEANRETASVAAENARVEQPVRRPRVRLLSSALNKLTLDDPEVLLSRMPVVCEGRTEVELLRALLDPLSVASGASLAALGVRLVDGGGQPHVFGVIDALRDAEFRIGTFLDEEVEHRGRRQKLEKDTSVVTGSFGSRSTEEALAEHLRETLLDELLDVGKDQVFSGIGRGRRQQLNDELGTPGERTPSELAEEHGWPKVREALGKTAAEHNWFKQAGTASSLADWLSDGRLPDPMRDKLAEFWVDLSPWTRLPTAAETSDDDSAE